MHGWNYGRRNYLSLFVGFGWFKLPIELHWTEEGLWCHFHFTLLSLQGNWILLIQHLFSFIYVEFTEFISFTLPARFLDAHGDSSSIWLKITWLRKVTVSVVVDRLTGRSAMSPELSSSHWGHVALGPFGATTNSLTHTLRPFIASH